jgi:hypothetical protein
MMPRRSGNIICYFVSRALKKQPSVPEADTVCAENNKAGHVAGMRWLSDEFSIPLVLAAPKNSAGITTCKNKRKLPYPPVID